MKNLLMVILLICFCSSSNGQLSSNCPFKTYVDKFNNLYVTGYEKIGATNDIYVAKYPPIEGSSYIWKFQVTNPSGDDVGLDLRLDSAGNCFVVGYSYNALSNSNDVILISLRPDGTERWMRIYENAGDDKGLGIEIAQDENGNAEEIYISGYVTSPLSGLDFFVKNYNKFGDPRWQYTSSLPGDDVATDIVVDNNFAYVIGHQTESNGINTDIKLMSFELNSGIVSDNLIYERPGTNEIPAEFLISQLPDAQRLKSRIAVVSVSDKSPMGGIQTRYLTLYFDEDQNQQLKVLWGDLLKSAHAIKTSLPTSITKNNAGDFFVTGYMESPRNPVTGKNKGLDFATVKYKAATGVYGWRYPEHIILNNYNDTSTTGMNDRASSIKINDRGVIYVAGMSDGSPNGFSIAEFRDEEFISPIKMYAFIPNFLNVDRAAKLNKWAKLELTSDGTPLLIAIGWNEFEAHWAAIKYDEQGNIEYTINNDPESDGNAESKITEAPNVTALKNYPNPFNPTTQLEFGISNLGFVSLKVYNMLGKQVAVLVNEKKSGGIHTVSFDGSGLSSGMYYYTLSVDGIRMETNSMVLMK